jgi:23S rRNA pseudouridine1911/1915/1917 synthase
MPEFPVTLITTREDAGQRLDHFLAAQLSETSRARIQQLIKKNEVWIDDTPAKASLRLKGGERVTVKSAPQAPPLRAVPEEIPLDIVYEDDDLVIINKPAGMMVHAGAGGSEDARNRGTLVNALLHRFGVLSGVGGELRPGIVHRLDRDTSGLMVVAKNDDAHRRVARQFSRREVHKTYIAVVHGWPERAQGTIASSIGRDLKRRTRMTVRRSGGREAVTHYAVVRRIASPYGKFSLLEVRIETGRTHQIRVHMRSAGHPVVGDTLYGAPRQLQVQSGKNRAAGFPKVITPVRNFLHSAAIELTHPKTGELLRFSRPIPKELERLLETLELGSGDRTIG